MVETSIKPRLLRVDQAAVILARSVREVYRLIKDGELQAHQVNPERRGLRITVESVEMFLSAHIIPREKWSE